ncbi:MAG: CHASE domain-containing protein [Candidatus Omnitrophica bacterium]|nr:CHASE domain-containing protein [Candidatus Omnitrophota bacterium]
MGDRIQPGFSWERRVPLLVLGCLLLASFLAWAYARYNIHQLLAKEMEMDAQAFEAQIEKRLDLYIGVLRGIAGLFAASDHPVRREEFAAYLNRIDLPRHTPGITGIRYVERASLQGREAFVVKYVEPPAWREKVLGFDVWTDEERRKTYERARDTGEPSATGRITLIQDIGLDEPSFSIGLPIYRKGAPASTPEERRAAIEGFVTASFRMRELMAGIFGKEGLLSGWGCEIFDGMEPAPEHLLFSTDVRLRKELRGQGAFVRVSTMEVAGRRWTLQFVRLSEPHLGRRQELLPTLALSAGLAVSLVTFGMLNLLAASNIRFAKAHGELTVQMAERKQAMEALAKQTGELKEANRELERFNKLAMGREKRIIELKAQVNELARALGQPPRYDLSFLEEEGGNAHG